MWVENYSDELWIGVKGQSNSVIARTPRNVFRNSLVLVSRRSGSDRVRAFTKVPTPDKPQIPET